MRIWLFIAVGIEGTMASPEEKHMSRHFADLAYTPTVQQAQQRYYGEILTTPPGNPEARLSLREQGFIAERDSFYLATVNENGWPHIQHRGGPAGFLRVLDSCNLAFADYDGNRQLVSTGNMAQHGQVALFLMDYACRRRLKILAHGRMLGRDEAGPDLLAAVHCPSAPPTERVMLLQVAAFDWNCPRYITPRFSERELLAQGWRPPA